MVVSFSNQKYECVRAEKHGKQVVLYNAKNTVIATISNITDFSLFTLEGGEWSLPPTDPRDLAIAQLMRDVADMKGGITNV